MKLMCPCGRADEYQPDRWSKPRRLAQAHIHGVQGHIWKTTHRRCTETKYVTDTMGRTMLAVWNEAEARILAPAR